MKRHTLALLLSTLVLAACMDVPEKGKISNHVTDWRDEIIYQLMVDRFSNGDRNNDYNVNPGAPAGYHGGDYQGLIDHLDYLKELGVTTIWISPVVKNVEEDAGVAGYHGYWAQDFTKVNPHFGDLAKLRELVDTCHDRDIKVILDIVTNHIGQLFYYDINQNGRPDEFLMGGGESAPITRMTEWDPDFDERGVQARTSLGPSGLAPIKWVWSPEINRVPPWPPAFANSDWYNRKGRVTVWGRESDACLQAGKMTQDEYDAGEYWGNVPSCFEYVRLQEVEGDFPGGLKDLGTWCKDTEDPDPENSEECSEDRDSVCYATRAKLAEVYADWIGRANFDGFRIDTVKHVERCFWRKFCPDVRNRVHDLGKRNFFMFGEAFDGNDVLLGSYTQGRDVEGDDDRVVDQGLDSVFYFSQKFQVFDGVVKYGGPTSNIENLWKARLWSPGQSRDGLNYGAKTYEKGPVDEEKNPLRPYQMLVNFLDNHDLPRFLYVEDGDKNESCVPGGGSCNDNVCDNNDSNLPGYWGDSGICRIDGRRHSCCDIDGLHLALGLLMTMDGIPCIYYGTEQQFNGGNDPANREDLWRSGFKTDNKTFKWIKKLTGIRKKYPPLRRGDLAIRWSTENTGGEQDAGIFAFERSYDGNTVLVVINASRNHNSETSASDSAGEDMQTSFSSGEKLADVLNPSDQSGGGAVSDGGRLKIALEPMTVKILVPRSQL